MTRPGLTTTGLVLPLLPGSTTPFLDNLLFDFDIDGFFPLKPKHQELLLGLIRFLKQQPGILTVSIDGFASHTGEERHNLSLSQNRERSVADFLRANTNLFDAGSPHRIDPNFHGFKESPPGEKAKYRSVRVVVHRPDLPPPPISIPSADQDDSTLFEISRVEFSSGGVALQESLKLKIVKIVDRDHRQEALFVYEGKGLALNIPILPFGTFSINKASRPVAFHTSRPVADLDDFEGDASLGHSGIQPNFLFFTISSQRLTRKGIRVKERPIQVNNPGTFDASILAPTNGELKRVSGISSPSRPSG